jgi:hypothetical protein
MNPKPAHPSTVPTAETASQYELRPTAFLTKRPCEIPCIHCQLLRDVPIGCGEGSSTLCPCRTTCLSA